MAATDFVVALTGASGAPYGVRLIEVLLRAGQLERRLAARAIEGLPASSIARAVHLLGAFTQRLEEKQIGVVR